MYSYHILDLKDANGKRPLDYLISNWTETTPPLLQTTLQRWLVDRLACWGATEAMASKVQVILDEDDKEERATLCTRAYSVFENYERMEPKSLLEMSLWKGQLQHEWSNDGTERQALDRGECLYVCGSDVVISNVVEFLYIHMGPPNATH